MNPDPNPNPNRNNPNNLLNTITLLRLEVRSWKLEEEVRRWKLEVGS